MADNKNHTTVDRATRFANAKNPWLGLGSYNEGQQLYGRDKETTDLTDIIVHHTASVVYGKSGIGKSSLLRAGVFPQLRQNGFVPIYLRLAHNTDVPYTQQVENAIAENVMLKDLLLESNIPDMGLWDFLHRHQFFDANGDYVTPVLVLDQFEEIFTLTQVEHKSDVQAFFTELADVLNDVKPDRVIEAEAAYNRKTAQPQDAANTTGFVLQSLSSASLKYEKSPSFRIVFSLRDDSLYLLERSSAKIPALKTNRYNLRALDEDSALDVITKPCPDLFSEKAAREILDGLAYYEYDDYRVVDPAILSLFLYTYYQEQGKVSYSDIFGRYYKECTKDIQESSIAYIEDHLLTERGNRNQIPFADIVAAGVAQGELELLLERKILKTEKRKGHDYAEFSHDRLCDQALKHREERKLRQQTRKMRKRMLMASLVTLALLGIFLVMFWQNSERLQARISADLAASKERIAIYKAHSSEREKKQANRERDSISKLNHVLDERGRIIELQNLRLKADSIAKEKHLARIQQDSIVLTQNRDSLSDAIKLSKEKEREIEFQAEMMKRIQGMALYNSCISMRTAVENGNFKELATANRVFKSCKTHYWGGSLQKIYGEELSFNDHFIFSSVFVDSMLSQGNKVYKYADQYNRIQSYQAAIREDEETVNYKTCMVGASSSVKYAFYSKGHQELAFVTEPKGIINIRVFDKTHNERYNYDMDLPYRFVTLELPTEKRSRIEVEIINKTNRNISFVIISN